MSSFLSSHWLRWFVVLIIILLLFVLAIGVVSFIFSNQLLDSSHDVTFSLEATHVSATSVTLPLNDTTDQVGIFGISWADGQAAEVGPITSKTQTTVTRPILRETAPLAEHTLVNFNRDIFFGSLAQTLGLPISTLQIAGPLGNLPALYVPGTAHTWAILIHGRNDPLVTGLRFVHPLAQAGLPIIITSYRNDVGAPASPDGLLHLGDSEWQDVEASARYALDHGAQHLVLYGWSMGGSIAEEFMHRSTYASKVQALVLDAPVLDWRTTLIFQSERRNLPGALASVVEAVSTLRTGINFDNLDQLDQKQSDVPVLLFHGTNDTSTPISVSDAFAKAHADIVTYERVSGAEHTQAWNINPQKYEAQVSTFLARVLAPK